MKDIILVLFLLFSFNLDAQLNSSTTEIETGKIKSNSTSQISMQNKVRLTTETASTVPFLDANKDLTSSSVTNTELGYLSGVNAALQTQIDGKASLTGDNTFSGTNDFQAPLTVTGTTFSSRPCPPMTEAQRDAIGSPVFADCVANSDTNTLNIYSGTEWIEVGGGGGLSKWASSTDYDTDDVIWEGDSRKIYTATSTFTSGGSFDDSNWDELSKSQADEIELVDDGSFTYSGDAVTCLSATKTYESGGVGKGSGQVKIDFTADGQECTISTSVSDATKDNNDQLYVASIYLKTSDATVGLEWADFTTTKETAEVVNSGEYIPYSYQIIPSSSIVTKITGDTGDTAYVDLVSHKLGGLERAPSKNCSDEFDCENKFSGRIEQDGSSANVASEDISIMTCTRSGTGEGSCTYTTAFQNVLTTAPTVDIHGCDTGTSASAQQRAQSLTTSGFDYQLRSAGGSLFDGDFCYTISKQGSDFKPIQEKGVVLTGSSNEIRFLSESAGGQSIGASPVTYAIASSDVEESKLASLDDANDEIDFEASGKIQVILNVDLVNLVSGDVFDVYYEINSGGGFSQISVKCQTRTDSTRSSLSCARAFNVSKGDALRVRLVSDDSNSSIQSGVNTSLEINSKVDRETIAGEFEGVVKSDNENPVRIESCLVGAGDGTPSSDSTLCSSWIDSYVDNGTGDYTVNFNTGIFSSAVECQASVTFGGSYRVAGPHSASSSSVDVTVRDQTNALSDQDFNLLCIGER